MTRHKSQTAGENRSLVYRKQKRSIRGDALGTSVAPVATSGSDLFNKKKEELQTAGDRGRTSCCGKGLVPIWQEEPPATASPIDHFDKTLTFFVSHGSMKNRMPYDWANPLKDWQAVKAEVERLKKCITTDMKSLRAFDDENTELKKQLDQSQREREAIIRDYYENCEWGCDGTPKFEDFRKGVIKAAAEATKENG